jgi:predicted RND superfamily exporter protein
VILALFLVAAILSVVFMGRVTINYDISEYLDDSTETKISLGIINKEFGATGNVQVMIENIDRESASAVRDTLASIPNVLTVSFDPDSENSYKDGNALFVILADGNEYSAVGRQVVEDVKAALDSEFSGRIHYGGAIVEKAKLRAAIEGEIPFILVISVCLAIAIMLLTSKSWLEPFVLLTVSGVAILLNMGTNALLGEISYITNAVSAILQLALSIDYSIVLLHAYRAEKLTESDHSAAMGKAVKSVMKPVSASALTTVAGLLALLFMSFRIGFDIGTVLMKGIVISAITSLTLLPAVVLLLDKLMCATEKKTLVFRGRGFCKLSFRAGALVVPVAVLLIVASAFLQARNAYSFTDKNSGNETISEAFGQNSAIVIVYPHNENNIEYEKALAGKLTEYKTADGKYVLKSYTAYSNTVKEVYDMEKASRKLSLPMKDVELLYTMYHLDQNPAQVKLSILEFLEYTNRLLTEDEDAQGLADANMKKTVSLILSIREIMHGEYTAEEFHAALTKLLPADTAAMLDPMLVDQLYGLYFYDTVEETRVPFMTMFDFLVELAQRDRFAFLIGAERIEQIREISATVHELLDMAETPLSMDEFRALAAEKFGMSIDSSAIWVLYAGYNKEIGKSSLSPAAPIGLLDYIYRLADDPSSIVSGFVDAEVKKQLGTYLDVYDAVCASYAYDELLPTVADLAGRLDMELPALDGYDIIVQQAYILYFNENDMIALGSIPTQELLTFIIETAENNALINIFFTDSVRSAIDDLYTADAFLQDDKAYDFNEMAEKLEELKRSIKSIAISATVGTDILSGIYIKYAIANDLGLNGAIEAMELLRFVTSNMDTNELLKLKMTDDNREKVLAAKKAVASAEALFKSKNYDRMLISVDLPAESEASTEFAKYLTASVKEIFGEDAHAAGELMSTYDLQAAFAQDNAFITVFTIVSIFLIVAIVFRSLSLPVVLVAIIQGAVWIAMSTSLLTGPMFFMSYIVTTCILMGATIDYGILMSTSYVQSRATLDKREALYASVAAAMPTIFTSGMILMICGFVIGFIASQNAIATVGILLGKGTLVSMLMVTLVLPSILYLLDGFVLKLTFRGRAAKK